ncbi:MAG: nucleoside triphosphate pyrophosphohydrolase [Methyloligellaceae bacterium]
MTDSCRRKTMDELLAIMAALRTPKTGCPWDLEQNFETIAPYTIEEAYEVADAIERDDMEALEEELGDLLLQVVYHAQMAAEVGRFDFADVVDGISTKMVRRHPHVFGDDSVKSSVEMTGLWERIKAEEKAARGSGAEGSSSVLAGVPMALPALTRAVKLQNKAAKVGFDWPGLGPVFDKAKEELAELEVEMKAVAEGNGDRDKVTEEYGDFLFVVANLARHLGIDPEGALRATNAKFVRRFNRVEELLAGDGRSPEASDLAEMDRLWDQVKEEESEG